jgi:hypothetical protein
MRTGDLKWPLASEPAPELRDSCVYTDLALQLLQLLLTSSPLLPSLLPEVLPLLQLLPPPSSSSSSSLLELDCPEDSSRNLVCRRLAGERRLSSPRGPKSSALRTMANRRSVEGTCRSLLDSGDA